MNDKTVLLLNKLIQLTNNKAINWEVYETSSLSLNPEDRSIFSTGLLINAFSATPLPSRSYIARYKKGYIALFAYSNMGISVVVKLILQASDDTTPQIIAASNDEDSVIASKIKRLFNLVDFTFSETDVSNYLDDILSD